VLFDERFGGGVPSLDEEVRWAGGGGAGGSDAEPGAVADAEGGVGRGEDQVQARWEVFDAFEAWGGGEGEEVYASESSVGEVKEEDGGGV